jgi:RNA polymerase sigma factor (sigma-70 family)
MTLTVPNDEQLVDAARDGDDRAFEELYERYGGRIKAFARRLTRDPDRADDLTQEVFISALRRLRATDRPIDFRPWIYEIARNACIDEYRRRKRVQEVPIDRDGLDGWLEHLSGGPSPEVAMESKQQLEDLQGAFRGLSERHHRIIVLRELEGKSYQQIGDELGMSQVVVESTLFRARHRLGKEFQDLSSGRRCEQVLRIIGTAPTRRLGLRDRRAVSRHIEHCRPCRREALSAGFSLQLRPAGRLQKAAAAIFPIPLLRLLRRGGSAVSAGARSLQQSAASLSSPIAGYVGSGTFGSGRVAAAAATVLAAALGGGLLTEVTQAPAHGVRPGQVAVHSGRGRAAMRVSGPLATGQAVWRRAGVARGSALPAARTGSDSRRSVAVSGTALSVAPALSGQGEPVSAPAGGGSPLAGSGSASGGGLGLGGSASGVSVSQPGRGSAPGVSPTGIQLSGSSLNTVPSGSSGSPASAIDSVVSGATAAAGAKLRSAG